MAELHSKFLALKRMRDFELKKLSELEDRYDKVSTSVNVLAKDEIPEDALKRNKFLQIMAELALLKQRLPRCFPPNELALLSSVQKSLSTEIQNLHTLKSSLQGKKESLLLSQKKSNTHIEQENKLLNSIKQKCVSQGVDIQNLCNSTSCEESDGSGLINDPVSELKEKILCLKELTKLRNSQVVNFLNTYFPTPTEEQLNNTSRIDIFIENHNQPVKSLEKTINVLILSHIHNIQNSWVKIDSSYWIPYVEFLIRCGIAVRNEEDPSLMKLENFEL